MATNAEAAQPPSWLQRVLIGRNPKRTLVRIVVLVAVCFVVFKFVLVPIHVDGGSMLPTYKANGVNFVYSPGLPVPRAAPRGRGGDWVAGG